MSTKVDNLLTTLNGLYTPYMFDIQSAEILFTEARKLNLEPKWLTDYGFFSIQIGKKTEYIFYGRTSLNSQIASYLSKNKHLTRILLEKNSFLNIPFCLPQSFTQASSFLQKHKVIIAKPSLGQHSQNVHLVDSEDKLKTISLEQNILEKYINGTEYRCLVLNGKVIAVHHKQYEKPINDPENVQRISLEEKDWNPEMIKTAIKVAELIQLKIAAVDFMVDEQMKQFILEVNSAPGISRFHHPTKGLSVNFAKMLLTALIDKNN